MKWDDRQQAKRIETRAKDRVGVPADHFVTAPRPKSRHQLRKLRKLRRAIDAAIRQRDAR